MQKSKFIKKLVKIAVALVVMVLLGVISVKTTDVNKFFDLSVFKSFKIKSIGQVIMMIALLIVVNTMLQLIFDFVKPKSKRGSTLITVVKSVIQYVIAIVGICWGLTIFGVNVSTILASIGIIALIIGFGAESLIADVITGLFILFENEYNVGDIIEVNGFRGTVKKIGIRTTVIADTGDNHKIINNSAMLNVINRSNDVSKSVCDIGISYDEDLEKLEGLLPDILNNIYEAHKDIFQSVPMYVGVQEVSDSSIVLRFVAEVTEKNIFSANRVLNRDIYLAFKKNDIEIPYNQLDVHTR